ncbi:hypothetical protein [Methylobacterium brachiatum]|jgi:hypothetical protein
MTYDELMRLLIERQALIVHCSRPGKNADEQRYGNLRGDDLLFPGDLRNAIDAVAGTGELSCSVIWPDHLMTYGAVGIVLRPRSTDSVRSISPIDAGSSWDETTRKRTGGGVPFSAAAVDETFANTISYNEWVVADAECIGIFMHPTEPMEVAARVPMTAVEGFDPSVMDALSSTVGTVRIGMDRLWSEFPDLPIFTYRNGGIWRIAAGAASPYSGPGE